ncbi:uncharacterized protein FTOL_04454 [Fusarium torulosum]|uniref:Uncharacterized protein n=1 Tax=Fusarium torulosum TaxID=33205 RepID=A0AAE8M6Z7_9HYPO|nr:uncharacterized protein FTOL_04454 [Fusarium torulosum]
MACVRPFKGPKFQNMTSKAHGGQCLEMPASTNVFALWDQRTGTPMRAFETPECTNNGANIGETVGGAANFLTSTLGNTVGGLGRTVGNVTGAATRGVGDTLSSATGSTGAPIGNAVGNLGTGLEGGLNSISKGVEDAGQWKKP